MPVSWFKKYRWLVGSKAQNGVSCSICLAGLTGADLGHLENTTFVGLCCKKFKDFKTLERHNSTNHHMKALTLFSQDPAPQVVRLFRQHGASRQDASRTVISHAIRVILSLAHQEIALRGHTEEVPGVFRTRVVENLDKGVRQVRYVGAKRSFTVPCTVSEAPTVVGRAFL